MKTEVTNPWTPFVVCMLTVLSLLGCNSNECFGLVYEESSNQCVCPEGTDPDYERQACVSASGVFIEWGDLPVPYDNFDGGRADSGVMDTGLDTHAGDAGPDMPVDAELDVEPFDGGVDAGPPPAVAMARFPWNGYTTGSVHVANMAPVVNHPLRPKLVWEEVDDAHHYQVQMSTECSITDFRSCAFAAPELDQTTMLTTFRPASSLAVSMTAPVGARYTWRVRACSASDVCSGWTVPRYLDVGRDDHDYNGDGYADLAIGASEQSTPMTREGNMFVYFGGVEGVPSAPSVTYDNPLNREFGFFGLNIASPGDLNADGFADIAVGGGGYIYVFFGGAGGPAAAPLELENIVGAPRSVGDVNADGYADLGAQAFRPGSQLLFGRAGALETAEVINLVDGIGDGIQSFGRAGDLNGDGYADFVLEAPNASFPETREGVALVFRGASSVSTTHDSIIDNPLDQSDGRFGSSTGFGDFNGDGFSDILVGAASQNGEELSEGAAYVFDGSREGLSSSPSVVVPNPTHDAFGGFGASASGLHDVNGDGYDDVVVGAPERQRMREGAAYVFLGSASGIADSSIEFRNPLHQANAYFGEYLGGTGDINGEGYNDLLVTAYAQSNPENHEGSAYLFFGRMSGIANTPGNSLDNPSDQAGGRFGAGVAR